MLRAYPEQIIKENRESQVKYVYLQNPQYIPIIPKEYWMVLGISILITGISLIVAIYYLGKK